MFDFKIFEIIITKSQTKCDINKYCTNVQLPIQFILADGWWFYFYMKSRKFTINYELDIYIND